jgi:hypothetical protein
MDKALLGGTPAPRIAAQYGVSEDAVTRHRAHIPAKLAQAQDAKEIADADDLLVQLRGLRNKLVKILLAAEKSGDLKVALLGIREARACLELLAKLQGQLDEHAVVNILVLPEWERVRSALMDALAPYHDARMAVAAALRDVDARQ